MRAQTFTGMGGHHSNRSKTEEWLTPPEIIEALGGAKSFDLDPCAPAVQPFQTARRTYTISDNGLMKPWSGRVWLNPPYSNGKIGRWLAKLAEHDIGCALIFARTETDMFFRSVWDCASGLLFIRGRLNFHHPDGRRAVGNSGAPSVLCAYGADDLSRLSECTIDGKFVPLRFPCSLLVTALNGTWREVVAEWMRAHRGPIALDTIYRALAAHPKAKRNTHYREKIRQTLQQGPFHRCGDGLWESAV